ncbi:hypothetical protein E1B28_002035 [Marasmius oreades]|uniref:Uncharacterized protein n=1 Tax=Marasmius oreades TaxID=181124 RepID=A0A9P7V4V5_9AGAR|nr:uncharacterized protein E1B28_002035 [Marasmius oreades]KAG7100262.1 hypothetical protein E1B28_002035 [Marasmius oreades]
MVYYSATIQREEQQSDHVLDLASHARPGYPTGDPFLVRGISTAYWKSHLNSTNQDSVQKLIQTQYDALLKSATINGTNIYGGSWVGPPSRNLDVLNQTFAAMLLINTIRIPPVVNISNPTPPSSKKIGKIVGGVLGGLAFVAILLVSIFVFLRKRKIGESDSHHEVPAEYLPSPFVLPTVVREMEGEGTFPSRVVKSHPNAGRGEPVANPGGEVNVAPSIVGSESPINDPDSGLHAVPTAELVRVLNARLRHHSSGGTSDIMPPAYPGSQATG